MKFGPYAAIFTEDSPIFAILESPSVMGSRSRAWYLMQFYVTVVNGTAFDPDDETTLDEMYWLFLFASALIQKTMSKSHFLNDSLAVSHMWVVMFRLLSIDSDETLGAEVYEKCLNAPGFIQAAATHFHFLDCPFPKSLYSSQIGSINHLLCQFPSSDERVKAWSKQYYNAGFGRYLDQLVSSPKIHPPTALAAATFYLLFCPVDKFLSYPQMFKVMARGLPGVGKELGSDEADRSAQQLANHLSAALLQRCEPTENHFFLHNLAESGLGHVLLRDFVHVEWVSAFLNLFITDIAEKGDNIRLASMLAIDCVNNTNFMQNPLTSAIWNHEVEEDDEGPSQIQLPEGYEGFQSIFSAMGNYVSGPLSHFVNLASSSSSSSSQGKRIKNKVEPIVEETATPTATTTTSRQRVLGRKKKLPPPLIPKKDNVSNE